MCFLPDGPGDGRTRPATHIKLIIGYVPAGVVRGGHPMVEPAAETTPSTWTIFKMSQWA